jgi:hypothetical protein
VQCQYPYADTQQHETSTDRSPDDRRNHPHDPMTTPDDATTTEATRTTDRQTTTETDRTVTETDRTATETDRTATETDRTATLDASPRQIPGRTPITEEAGAPLVPPTRTGTTAGTDAPEATDARAIRSGADTAADRFEPARRREPLPADEGWGAPLVPDLRPTRRPRTDGGSR